MLSATGFSSALNANETLKSKLVSDEPDVDLFQCNSLRLESKLPNNATFFFSRLVSGKPR